MYRVYVSRFINHRLLNGKPDEMVSSRIYREKRYGWRLTIDLWFYWLLGQQDHCRQSYLWERSVNSGQTTQVADRRP